MIYHSDPEPSYWEVRREIDIEHDRMVEEFAQRDRDWDRRRKESDLVFKESLKCFNIVSILSQKRLIPVEIYIDFVKQEGFTAYLPIEVGAVLKKIHKEEDVLTMLELYKTNF